MSAFIDDMPAAFAEADLIICRSGAGAVSELAAAGKAAVLIPFPFATDDHQLRNAEAMQRAGAAWLSTDREWSASKMCEVIQHFAERPEDLARMSAQARSLGKPGAARRVADILEQIGAKAIDSPRNSRNNTV